MPKASPAIVNFNSGEWSSSMAGRIDIKYYNSACRLLSNFIPRVQGPARNRPGTHYVDSIKNHGHKTWLRRFVFNDSISYMMEFGNAYIRFYSGHGQVKSGGVPVEVVTPFLIGDLVNQFGSFSLRFAQSGDVMYIASGKYPLQKLTRTGPSTFSIAAADLKGGPFNQIDPDETIQVISSASTGNVTLTASAGLFAATDVGRLFMMEQSVTDAIPYWEPNKAITAGAYCRSDGKNYVALNSATTGTIKPTHSIGSKFDGTGSVRWDFMDSGYGWVVITGYTSPTVVGATVLSRIPIGATNPNATNRFAFSAFSSVDGYPTDVVFYGERLVLSKGLEIFGSVVGDFENFSSKDDGGIVTKDMAFKHLVMSDEANDIVWVAPLNSALMVGTYGEEYALMNNTLTEAFGPGNIKSVVQSSYGSHNAAPTLVGNGVVYIQKSAKKVRDMVQAESVDTRWVSADTTVLADHITGTGLIQLAYQQDPDSVVWGLRDDGVLVGFTLDRDQDVRGWHPHRLNGAFVECIEVMPTDVGTELWMIARRTINGQTKRYVEYLGEHYLPGDDPDDAFYVDSGLSLYNYQIDGQLIPGVGADVVGTLGVQFMSNNNIFSAGDVGKYFVYKYITYDVLGKIQYNKAVARIDTYDTPNSVLCAIMLAWPVVGVPYNPGTWLKTTNTISGLDHLEGETVAVAGDGAVLPQVVVTGGSITLQTQVAVAHVGKPITSILSPMPMEAGAADGTAQGKTKRISKCIIRLSSSLGVKYGANYDSELSYILSLEADGIMDTPPQMFTGDVTVSWPDGYSEGAPMTIVQDSPLPCTVVALMPQITTFDDR